MAKKRFVENPDEEELVGFDPLSSLQKLPTDIANGKKPITDYMEVPVTQIIEYQNKQNSDFHPYDEIKFNQLVESIKKNGVLEAVTLRAIGESQFEVLAGEHRWKAAAKAGLKTVPAHVLRNISDAEAANYFSLTNLLRRDLSVVDRVNGWWLWLRENNRQGFRNDLLDIAQENEPDADIGRRQIQRFAKMHELIPELLAQLDNPNIQMSINVGYQLAFLTQEEQKTVYDFGKRLTETEAKALHDLSNSGNWSEQAAKEIVFAPKQATYTSTFTALTKSVKKLAKKTLKPEYYESSPAIFEEALELYLQKHPEARK